MASNLELDLAILKLHVLEHMAGSGSKLGTHVAFSSRNNFLQRNLMVRILIKRSNKNQASQKNLAQFYHQHMNQSYSLPQNHPRPPHGILLELKIFSSNAMFPKVSLNWSSLQFMIVLEVARKGLPKMTVGEDIFVWGQWRSRTIKSTW